MHLGVFTVVLCYLHLHHVSDVSSQSVVPGYLDFDNLPETNFSCQKKVIGGYYADIETGCQMFHVCTIGQKGEVTDIKFLCLNGTVFDQATRVCERVDEVDCSKAEEFFDLNLELYGNNAFSFQNEDEDGDTSVTERDSHKEDTTTAKPTTTTTTTTTTPRPTEPPTTTRKPSTSLPTLQYLSITTHRPLYNNHNQFKNQQNIRLSQQNGGYHQQNQQQVVTQRNPNVNNQNYQTVSSTLSSYNPYLLKSTTAKPKPQNHYPTNPSSGNPTILAIHNAYNDGNHDNNGNVDNSQFEDELDEYSSSGDGAFEEEEEEDDEPIVIHKPISHSNRYPVTSIRNEKINVENNGDVNINRPVNGHSSFTESLAHPTVHPHGYSYNPGNLHHGQDHRYGGAYDSVQENTNIHSQHKLNTDYILNRQLQTDRHQHHGGYNSNQGHLNQFAYSTTTQNPFFNQHNPVVYSSTAKPFLSTQAPTRLNNGQSLLKRKLQEEILQAQNLNLNKQGQFQINRPGNPLFTTPSIAIISQTSSTSFVSSVSKATNQNVPNNGTILGISSIASVNGYPGPEVQHNPHNLTLDIDYIQKYIETTPPNTYDEYIESDVQKDPFYKDVPRIGNKKVPHGLRQKREVNLLTELLGEEKEGGERFARQIGRRRRGEDSVNIDGLEELNVSNKKIRRRNNAEERIRQRVAESVGGPLDLPPEPRPFGRSGGGGGISLEAFGPVEHRGRQKPTPIRENRPRNLVLSPSFATRSPIVIQREAVLQSGGNKNSDETPKEYVPVVPVTERYPRIVSGQQDESALGDQRSAHREVTPLRSGRGRIGRQRNRDGNVNHDDVVVGNNGNAETPRKSLRNNVGRVNRNGPLRQRTLNRESPRTSTRDIPSSSPSSLESITNLATPEIPYVEVPRTLFLPAAPVLPQIALEGLFDLDKSKNETQEITTKAPIIISLEKPSAPGKIKPKPKPRPKSNSDLELEFLDATDLPQIPLESQFTLDSPADVPQNMNQNPTRNMIVSDQETLPIPSTTTVGTVLPNREGNVRRNPSRVRGDARGSTRLPANRDATRTDGEQSTPTRTTETRRPANTRTRVNTRPTTENTPAFTRDVGRVTQERVTHERRNPVRGTPERGNSERGTPERRNPERETPERGTPVRGTPAKSRIPVRVTTEIESPDEEILKRGTQERGSSEQRTPGRVIPQRTAEEGRLFTSRSRPSRPSRVDEATTQESLRSDPVPRNRVVNSRSRGHPRPAIDNDPAQTNAPRQENRGAVTRSRSRSSNVEVNPNNRDTLRTNPSGRVLTSRRGTNSNLVADRDEGRSRSRGGVADQSTASQMTSEQVVPATVRSPLPETSFSCNDKVPGGYYADLEADCQLFHICSQGRHGRIKDNKFLCGPGTRFNQQSRTCQTRDLVDCHLSASLYHLNNHFTLPALDEPVPAEETGFEAHKVQRRKRSATDGILPAIDATTSPSTTEEPRSINGQNIARLLIWSAIVAHPNEYDYYDDREDEEDFTIKPDFFQNFTLDKIPERTLPKVTVEKQQKKEIKFEDEEYDDEDLPTERNPIETKTVNVRKETVEKLPEKVPSAEEYEIVEKQKQKILPSVQLEYDDYYDDYTDTTIPSKVPIIDVTTMHSKMPIVDITTINPLTTIGHIVDKSDGKKTSTISPLDEDYFNSKDYVNDNYEPITYIEESSKNKTEDAEKNKPVTEKQISGIKVNDNFVTKSHLEIVKTSTESETTAGLLPALTENRQNPPEDDYYYYDDEEIIPTTLPTVKNHMVISTMKSVNDIISTTQYVSPTGMSHIDVRFGNVISTEVEDPDKEISTTEMGTTKYEITQVVEKLGDVKTIRKEDESLDETTDSGVTTADKIDDELTTAVVTEEDRSDSTFLPTLVTDFKTMPESIVEITTESLTMSTKPDTSTTESIRTTTRIPIVMTTRIPIVTTTKSRKIVNRYRSKFRGTSTETPISSTTLPTTIQSLFERSKSRKFQEHSRHSTPTPPIVQIRATGTQTRKPQTRVSIRDQLLKKAEEKMAAENPSTESNVYTTNLVEELLPIRDEKNINNDEDRSLVLDSEVPDDIPQIEESTFATQTSIPEYSTTPVLSPEVLTQGHSTPGSLPGSQDTLRGFSDQDSLPLPIIKSPDVAILAKYAISNKESNEGKFNCLGKELHRFYPDNTSNKLFHYCSPGFHNKQMLDFQFVCDNGTSFNAELEKCE